MKKNSIFSLLLLCIIPVTGSLNAQPSKPVASPLAVFKQQIGVSEIEITYSRPGVKDREIFGELVPYGEIWRTGANAPTKVKVSDGISLEGHSIPAGTYALYTVPGKDSWTVLLSKELKPSHQVAHDEKNEVVRFEVEPVELDDSVETFTIGVEHIRNDSAILHLDWAKVRVPIKMTMEIPASEG